MAHGVTVFHLEFLADAYGGAEMQALLYDDEADDPAYDDDVGTIDSEPTDGSYTRDTRPLADLIVQTDAEIVEMQSPDLEFDLTDTTGEVDSIAFVWAHGGTERLMVRKPLDDRYVLDDHTGPTTVGATWQLATLY